jgi:hypothetical protein
MDIRACLFYGTEISGEENERCFKSANIDDELDKIGVSRDGLDNGRWFLSIKESEHEEGSDNDVIEEIVVSPAWKDTIRKALGIVGIDDESRPIGWYIVTKI